MKTRMKDDEGLLREARANLQRGIETVGGRLYLTTHRLVFEAHSFNIQSGATSIHVRNVRRMRKCWTKFLGILPVFPNSLAVSTARGVTYQFVLGQRDAWIRDIRAAQEEWEDEHGEE